MAYSLSRNERKNVCEFGRFPAVHAWGGVWAHFLYTSKKKIKKWVGSDTLDRKRVRASRREEAEGRRGSPRPRL